MKTRSFTILFLLIVLLQISCNKEKVASNIEIFGKWYLNSILDTKTSKSVMLPDNKKVIVIFNKDLSITEIYENTTPTEFAFVGPGSKFDIEDTSLIRIINLASATADGYLYTINKLDASKLILTREQGFEYTFSRK